MDHYFPKAGKEHRKDHIQLPHCSGVPSTCSKRARKARWAFGLTFPSSSHLVFSVPLTANGTLSLLGPKAAGISRHLPLHLGKNHTLFPFPFICFTNLCYPEFYFLTGWPYSILSFLLRNISLLHTLPFFLQFLLV